jgi:dihydrofolate reductase
MSSNRVIGKDGGLPWKIPEDSRFFRDKTMGHIMLMGRTTFDSFGRPLPGRLHVVVTRQMDYRPAGAQVFHSLESALLFCRSQTQEWGNEVFIVGGAEIYRELLPITERIYMTEIDQEFQGDAYFPEIDPDEFTETARSSRTEPLPYHFVTYDRKAR